MALEGHKKIETNATLLLTLSFRRHHRRYRGNRPLVLS